MSVFELIGLLETYHRYEEFISKKENEIYAELSRNIEQFVHHSNSASSINNNLMLTQC